MHVTANLIEKKGQYYCSECMMRQNLQEPYCNYCGSLFSNWEEIVMKIYFLAQQDNAKLNEIN